MTKSWQIDQLLPAAKDFYSTLEQQLQCSLYHPLAIRRYFIHSEDAARALRKIKNPRFSPLSQNSPHLRRARVCNQR